MIQVRGLKILARTLDYSNRNRRKPKGTGKRTTSGNWDCRRNRRETSAKAYF